MVRSRTTNVPRNWYVSPRPSKLTPGEGAHLDPHHQRMGHPWPSSLTPTGGGTPHPSPTGEGAPSSLTTGEGAPLTLVYYRHGRGTPRPSPTGEGHPSSITARERAPLVPRHQGRGHTSSLTIRGHNSSLTTRRGSTPGPSLQKTFLEVLTRQVIFTEKRKNI